MDFSCASSPELLKTPVLICAYTAQSSHRVPVSSSYRFSVCSPPYSALILIFPNVLMDIIFLVDGWKSLKHFLVAGFGSATVVTPRGDIFSFTLPHSELSNLVKSGIRRDHITWQSTASPSSDESDATMFCNWKSTMCWFTVCCRILVRRDVIRDSVAPTSQALRHVFNICIYNIWPCYVVFCSCCPYHTILCVETLWSSLRVNGNTGSVRC